MRIGQDYRSLIQGSDCPDTHAREEPRSSIRSTAPHILRRFITDTLTGLRQRKRSMQLGNVLEGKQIPATVGSGQARVIKTRKLELPHISRTSKYATLLRTN